MEFVRLLFLFSGRIGRAAFWLAMIFDLGCATLVGLAASAALRAYAGAAGNASPPPFVAAAEAAMPIVGGLVAVSVCAVFVWSLAAVQVKRWHDLDKTWLWLFATLVPLVGPLWVVFECGTRPGTPRDNRFGAPQPLPLAKAQTRD